MRFFDLDPETMRVPSDPDQTILGDRGEYLSSVLRAICEDLKGKRILMSWIEALTRVDLRDLKFPTDPDGRILVTLVEKSGRTISAASVSDGTLRLLAIVAAILGPEPPRFCFFEEPEKDIHPNLTYLPVELMENQAAAAGIQVVATTHSPQLLRYASPATRENVSVTYRLEGQREGRIKRMFEIPYARTVIEDDDVAHLHESNWFETNLAFAEHEAVEA
jgi:predicted ATPase